MTGMTGAGRSTAAKELEDLGYYVVDNLPPVAAARRRPAGRREPRRRSSRSRSSSTSAPARSSSPCTANLAQGATGRKATLVFLEATDDVLVRRQEAARRPHPLQGAGRLLDGLQRERVVLGDVRSNADLVIDTTDLNVHQLTDRIAEAFGTAETTRLKVTVISFGFKYGIPVDADFVADMRFLPNPHWVPELRPLTGRDEPVADYVMSQPGPRSSSTATSRCCSGVADGYLERGQAVHDGGHRLHRRQAPQRRDDRGDRGAGSSASGLRRPRHPPRPRAGVTCGRPRSRPSPSEAATGCTPR